MAAMRAPGHSVLGDSRKLTSIVHYPIVVTTMPEYLTDADVELVIQGFDRLYAAEITFATLIDTRPLQVVPTPRQRWRLAEWASSRMDAHLAYGVCVAGVVATPLMRAALTAIHWHFECPILSRHTSSMREAVEFCASGILGRGLALPSTYESLLRA